LFQKIGSRINCLIANYLKYLLFSEWHIFFFHLRNTQLYIMRRCNCNVLLHSPYLGLQCFWRIDSPFVGPSLMVTTIWTFRSRRYGVVFWQENSLIRQTNRGHGNALKVKDNNLHLFYFINRETYKSSLKLRRCRKGKLCNC